MSRLPPDEDLNLIDCFDGDIMDLEDMVEPYEEIDDEVEDFNPPEDDEDEDDEDFDRVEDDDDLYDDPWLWDDEDGSGNYYDEPEERDTW